MSTDPTSQVTRILEAVRTGDPGAPERLLDLVYEELRRLARSRLARERPGQTLQPTALVHEAYLRLFAGQEPRWENRSHFFGAAAEAMRRILIERARRHSRLKRGGSRERVTLDEDATAQEGGDAEELLALDLALDRLEQRDPVMARVVALRYFAGLTVEETADTLDMAPRTVNRHWLAARAWLQREMGR